MVRHGILALAILVAAVVPARAADTHRAGRDLVTVAPRIYPSKQHPSHHRSFNRRPFIPYWGVSAYAPPVWYRSYVTYAPVPVYESPPAYSQPADSTTSIDLGLPPIPSVVPFPNGRYVLRGDGLTSPYKWVWIPNPPTAPPTAPPEASPAPSTPPPAEPAASHRAALYRWVDDEGVVHFTQGRDAVPERYRAQMKLAVTP
jgi:Domain of unknown function (DUF4124)